MTEFLSVLSPKEVVADLADDLGGVKVLLRQGGEHEYDIVSAMRDGLATNPVSKLLGTTDKTLELMKSTRTVSGVLSSTGLVGNRILDLALKANDIKSAVTPDEGQQG